MDEKDRKKIISRALQQLASDDAAIVTMFYYDELTVEEISSVTGLGESNVKVKMYRARKKLHSILSRMPEAAIRSKYLKLKIARTMKTDDQLKKLVQSAGIESPSDNFTTGVMEKINLQRETITIRPVSAKAGWIVFGFLAALFFIAAFFPGSSDAPAFSTGYDLKPVSDTFFFTVSRISEIIFSSRLIVLVILSGGGLFILDYLFSQKQSGMRKA